MSQPRFLRLVSFQSAGERAVKRCRRVTVLYAPGSMDLMLPFTVIIIFSQSVFDCKISVVIAQDDKSPAVGAGHIHQNTFGKICSFQGGFEFIKAAYRLLAYFRDHIAGQEAAT